MVLFLTTWMISLASIAEASLKESTKDLEKGYSNIFTSSEGYFPGLGSGLLMPQMEIDIKACKDKNFRNIHHDMVVEGQKYGSKPQKDRAYRISGKSGFDNPYWDQMSAEITGNEKFGNEKKSGLSTSEPSNIISPFTVPNQRNKMTSDQLGQDTEFVLSEQLALFVRPDYPTHLMKMDQIDRKTIDWLWNFACTCTKELSPHIEAWRKLPIAKDLRPWELIIFDKFMKFKPEINNDKEWVRRFQSFRFQLYPHLFCKLWQGKKNNVSEDTRKFVHTLHLHKPHPGIISLASKKEIQAVTKFLGKFEKPEDLNEAFTHDYVDSVIELFQLRERQLNLSGSKCVFGPEFLFTMRTQGITETLFIRLEIILELSSPKVYWANLDYDKKIAKCRAVLNAISDFSLQIQKEMEGEDVSTKIEPTWESHFVLEMLHRNPEISKLVTKQVNVLIKALSDCNSRPLTFQNMFSRQEYTPWQNLKVQYQEALAAAISGLQLKDLGSIKFSMNKFPVGSIKKKCLYWGTPYLKNVDIEKLREYSETLGYHMLKYNTVDEEGRSIGDGVN